MLDPVLTKNIAATEIKAKVFLGGEIGPVTPAFVKEFSTLEQASALKSLIEKSLSASGVYIEDDADGENLVPGEYDSFPRGLIIYSGSVFSEPRIFSVRGKIMVDGVIKPFRVSVGCHIYWHTMGMNWAWNIPFGDNLQALDFGSDEAFILWSK